MYFLFHFMLTDPFVVGNWAFRLLDLSNLSVRGFNKVFNILLCMTEMIKSEKL